MNNEVYSGVTRVMKSNNVVIVLLAEIPKGYQAAGKIIYNPKEMLGRGCEGTFVYK